MKLWKGFTLIELLITMTIMGIMALVAIPSFEKYGKNAEFKQKVTEIQSLIDQIDIMSKNPEKGVSIYFLSVNTSEKKMDFYKRDDSGVNSLIKEIALPLDYTISLGGGTGFGTKNLLICESLGKFCCRDMEAQDGSIPACSLGNKTNNQDFISISNGEITSVFRVYGDPFRVVVN